MWYLVAIPFFQTSSIAFPCEPYHYYVFFKMSNKQLNKSDLFQVCLIRIVQVPAVMYKR